MTLDSLKQYFKKLLELKGIKGQAGNEIVDKIVPMGVGEFWRSNTLAMKENSTTVTTTASTETVDLPDDFDGLLSVIEKTSSHGRKLINLPAEEYDRLIPYSDSHNTDTPQYYKVYYNSDSGVWQLALYPTPGSALTLYIKYHSVPYDVPDKYLGAVVPCVWKYYYDPGTPDYSNAVVAYEVALRKIKTIDTPEKSKVDHFNDSGTKYEPRVQQWYEDP